MASLIPGYNYDVFISYRQKDNKYDGWVTDFVDNLKRELESTFKDEISVYFDINPQDGLQETHDVDASLEKKLKCLIFIPIISRTYCDPKSYAWDHEFKAFIEQASQDHFGLKVTLPSGNVANRLLPIRINDLDNVDIKLLESLLGGMLRGIDFIYKSSGVNRPLRSKEDNPHDNINHTIYRDQINKVALTVRDIVESMKVSNSSAQVKQKEIQVKESEDKKEIKVEQPVEKQRIKPKQKKQADKIKTEIEKVVPLLRKPWVLILGIILIITILVALIFIQGHHSKVRWAKETAIPEIYRKTNESNYMAAFDLAVKAMKLIPDDPEIKKIWPYISNRISIKSEPSGAKIFRRDYDGNDTSWIYIGTTPIDSINFPFSFSRIKVEKKGFQTVYDATNSTLLNIRNYLLDSIGSLPENMVHIPSIKISFNIPGQKNIESTEIKDFLIDKYEVTNKQFKEFIKKGGYQNGLYWKYPFIKNGRTLGWEEAMAHFVDKTGRNGPSSWEAGDYPRGEDNYPVGGVSWYEAAAYAEFAGKSLPTYYHWRRAADLDNRLILPRLILTGDGVWGISFVTLKSNFTAKSSALVGSYPGMTGYGTYDMVGNIREWVFNESIPGGQKFILGGGWSDPTYMASESYYQPPFDRSQINGFRCVKYLHIDDDLQSLQSPIEEIKLRDYLHEKPATDQQFSIFKRMYMYDKSDLNPIIESEDKSENFWIKQKITYNAAYGNERIIAYLFLPKSFKPPFQTVVYFPGSSALNMLSSKSLLGMMNIDFIIKNGRAVLYPVYKGTYERQFDISSTTNNDIADREHIIQWYKDLARSIDYLETRSDIDTARIAYFGFSWGGRVGPIMNVLENRIKTSVLYVAGLLYTGPYPEIDPFNYVHRVKIPTLMLNGKYDADFPYETSQKPLYELLGSSKENKHQFLYESGHFVPRNELIKETLDWLDKYLGEVKH